jgi:hypothetical protein
MKLRSLVIRTIFAWMPILPPPPLVAQLREQPSPQIFFCGPEFGTNSFRAWSEPQDRAFQRGVSRRSPRIGSAESKGV